MDLREKKTKRSLHNAFLEIRSKKPLEKITVKELCERAEISKATFYLHYRDIYDISDTLQMEVIDDIIKFIDDPKDLVYEPSKSSQKIMEGFYANHTIVNILFSGPQFSILPEKIEAKIKQSLFSKFPALENDIYANIRITYQLMGAFYSYYKYESIFGFDKVMESVNKIHDLFAK